MCELTESLQKTYGRLRGRSRSGPVVGALRKCACELIFERLGIEV